MNRTAVKSLEEAKIEANYRTAIACIKLGDISRQEIAYATNLPLNTIDELFREYAPTKPNVQ